MTSTVLRRLLSAVFVALVAVAPMPVAADYGDPTKRGPEHEMVFPVIGEVSYSDTFGAPRSGHSHAGQDIMGAKMQALVAAASGTISWITIPQASYGYMITITADDGWKYHYVHINNDTPGTDDGQAQLSDVFGPGIQKGARVSAGQLVGYLGDSGNAESTPPHLHFETVDPTGVTVNPMAALDAATRLAEPTGGSTTSAPSPFARLAGGDRVETALAVSEAGWGDGGASSVVIASATSYAEALPAGVLASKRGGPLLLVSGSTLSSATATELQRLGTKHVTTIGSVPAAVDDSLRARGLAVERIGGSDRLTTAVAIAKAVGNGGGVALVNADSFADGISAATLAAGRGWPILLSSRDYVPQVSVDAWRALGQPKVHVIGGPAVISDKVTAFFAGSRLAGADRYATSVAVAKASLTMGRSLKSVLAATGLAFPDALSAAPLAARRSGVTLLVDGSGSGSDAATRTWLSSNRAAVGDLTILGGTVAVSSAADRALQVALAR